jgi:hypothetical protein
MDMAIALVIPAFLSMLYMLLLIVQPSPWYQPQYSVPLVRSLSLHGFRPLRILINISTQEDVHVAMLSIAWCMCQPKEGLRAGGNDAWKCFEWRDSRGEITTGSASL